VTEHGRRVMRATLLLRICIVTIIALLGAILYYVVTTSEDTKITADNTESIVVGIEAQQDNNTSTINAAKETLERVIDCTEPGGECYGDGQKRTAEAVADIGQVSVYASACAVDPALLEQSLEQRADSIEKCVTRLLEIAAQPEGENR
jgi:hypothetical protein